MKITKRNLRRIISEAIESSMLLESARTFWQYTAVITLNNVDLSSPVAPRNNRLYLVMESADWFHMPKYARLISSGMFDNSYKIAEMASKERKILGMMVVKNPDSGRAYGAAEVVQAAAKRGYGPALYDLVIGDQPVGIYGDRDSIDPRAYDIYDYYLNKRDDIEKLPLDDPEQRYTKDTIDDMIASTGGSYLPWNYIEEPSHSLWLQDAANHVYKGPRHPNMQEYLQAGELAKESFAERWKISIKDVNDFFAKLALDFFDVRDNEG